MYINFICPPLPHLIWGGTALYRSGDKHESRCLSQTFDLIVMQSGRLYLQEEERRYVLERGDYLILASDMHHKGYQCCEGDTRFFWNHFYTFGDYTITETLPKVRPTRFQMSKLYTSEKFYLSLPQHGSISELNLPIVEKNLSKLSQFEVNRFLDSAKLVEASSNAFDMQQVFLRTISSLCKSDPQRDAKPNLAIKIHEHLLEHYTDPFDLQAIAQEYSFHPGYIIRCVNQQFEISPLQLLLRIRIEKAKQLLDSGKYSISEVSELVGFGNPAYFSRQFKRIVGQSPSEYYKNQGKPAQ